jgi:flagellar protein FlbT
MTNLVLELKPGEMMVINGAAIRFCTKSRIELTSRARFLFGKQIMPPDKATTPASRIYYALQTVYIGTDDERVLATEELSKLIGMFRDATTSASVKLILDTLERCAGNGDYYMALKLGRRIIRHEEAVLGASPGDGMSIASSASAA